MHRGALLSGLSGAAGRGHGREPSALTEHLTGRHQSHGVWTLCKVKVRGPFCGSFLDYLMNVYCGDVYD